MYITRFKTVNFLHYFNFESDTSTEPGHNSLGTSGKVRLRDMASKCGRGERESAPVDRAKKCDRKERESAALGTWRESVNGESGKVRPWTERESAVGESGKVRLERAGKCGFGDMAGKCGRGERESAPVDRAGK